MEFKRDLVLISYWKIFQKIIPKIMTLLGLMTNSNSGEPMFGNFAESLSIFNWMHNNSKIR